jgi:Trypsin-co-occurring domain 1
MNGDDYVARVVTARLPGDIPIRVELAEPVPVGGMQSAGLGALDLDKALDAVGHVGSIAIEKLKAAAPTKATVELKFGFSVEAGKLTALWIGGKGEASLTVTLEWSKAANGDGSGDDAASGDDSGDDEADDDDSSGS